MCPAFWDFPAEPQSGGYGCGTVTPNNLFAGERGPEDGRVTVAEPEQERLVGYQVYHLFHEIVHFYLGTDSLSEETVPEELYEWNDCVALDASDSIRNPMNYQLYLASKSVSCRLKSFRVLTSFLDVVAGCTRFPQPPYNHITKPLG